MVTAKQIAALKYMIFRSKDGTELSKRILAFLIEESKGLTRSVCLTLMEGREGYTADEIQTAAHGVSDMLSGNGTTHLHEICLVMGWGVTFSLHYGDFDPSRNGNPMNTDGQFAGVREDQVSRPGLARKGMPLRYTFWFAAKEYSRQAELVIATREKLEQMEIKKSGLR